MCRSAFKLTSIRSRDVSIVYPMIAQTSTSGAGSLCRDRMQAGEVQSPRSPQTRMQPSEFCTQNWDSSMPVLYPALSSLSKGSWCDYTVLQGYPHNMFVLSGVTRGRALRSCMPFSFPLSNPLILYSHDNGWMSISVTGNITER